MYFLTISWFYNNNKNNYNSMYLMYGHSVCWHSMYLKFGHIMCGHSMYLNFKVWEVKVFKVWILNLCPFNVFKVWALNVWACNVFKV